MNSEELKKKIVAVLKPVIKAGNISCNEENACKKCWFPCEIERTAYRLSDALIAAGIGDVEWQHDVFKKAYMDFFTKLDLDKKFRKNFDSITLGCKIGKFEDMIDQAEKELDEERKDEN